MPYPNEHAARITDPDKYDDFVRVNDEFDKGIHAIYGILDSGKLELQAIRFDASKYTADEAKKWLKDHDIDYILFEPAKGDDKMNLDHPSDLDYKDYYGGLELCSDDGEPEGSFRGYGAYFNNTDAYGDIILPGAFTDSVKRHYNGQTVKMLWQHDYTAPIGRWKTISEDDKGLYVHGQLELEVQKAREAYVLLKSKAIDGLSIGFVTEDSEPRPKAPGRKLKKLDLWEVSLVTFPANKRAKVGRVKSITTIRDLEAALRDAGFSRKDAKAIAAHGFRGLQRDAEVDVAALDALGEALLEVRKVLRKDV